MPVGLGISLLALSEAKIYAAEAKPRPSSERGVPAEQRQYYGALNRRQEEMTGCMKRRRIGGLGRRQTVVGLEGRNIESLTAPKYLPPQLLTVAY